MNIACHKAKNTKTGYTETLCYHGISYILWPKAVSFCCVCIHLCMCVFSNCSNMEVPLSICRLSNHLSYYSKVLFCSGCQCEAALFLLQQSILECVCWHAEVGTWLPLTPWRSLTILGRNSSWCLEWHSGIKLAVKSDASWREHSPEFCPTWLSRSLGISSFCHPRVILVCGMQRRMPARNEEWQARVCRISDLNVLTTRHLARIQ